MRQRQQRHDRRKNEELRDYKVVYGYRKRISEDTQQFECAISAYTLIEARELAYEEFNETTDFKVISVSLIR